MKNDNHKPEMSELYKLLPKVKEWEGFANWICIDECGDLVQVDQKPIIDDLLSKEWSVKELGDWVHIINKYIILPPSISWKDTLVSRQEMEAWEKSSDPESYEIDWSKLDPNATHHVFNATGEGYYVKATAPASINVCGDLWFCNSLLYRSFLTLPNGCDWKKSLRINPNIVKSDTTINMNAESPESFFDKSQMEAKRLEVLKSLESKIESPQAKVERLKLELKQAEDELSKTIPAQISDVSVYVLDHDVFAYNHHEYRVEQIVGNNLTSLTFFKK